MIGRDAGGPSTCVVPHPTRRADRRCEINRRARCEPNPAFDEALRLAHARTSPVASAAPKLQVVTDPTFLTIGSARSEYLRLQPLRRSHPERTDFWDGNWLVVTLDVRVGAFRATFPATFRTTDFGEFRRQLAALHHTLVGEAVLETLEEWVSLRIVGDGRGHLEVRGSVTDEPGLGNRLTFVLPELDQTQLPAMLDELDAMERAFPTVGAPDGS